ncbi:MAG: helicase-exonuclease AddAB subunit AddA [Clostridia bacterium]|nr:helicase-exonuclease AddAB subunit AddA [Clostridia bacterium]
MSNVVWTKEQESAIVARDAKVLVNAAAGSGKTAVLTSRIIRRLIPDNDEKPVRADRLLVVTFTRAAAAEMRERIERGLKNELIKASENGDLKKRRFVSNQIKQLSGAKISTIDSFCQSIVKEYFHILNISPSFQIVQKSEEKLMREEVFDRLTEKMYKEKNGSFIMLAESLARSGREDSVRELVEKLYDFSANLAYPQEFIDNAAEQYLCEKGFYSTEWAKRIENSINEKLKVYLNIYNDSLLDMLTEDCLISLITAERDSIQELYNMPLVEKMTAMREFKAEKKATEYGIITTITDNIADSIREDGNAFPEDTTELEQILKDIYYPQARALADVTIEFIKELDNTKRMNSVLSFSDIERMTYSLLADNEAIREEIKGRYDEILIDEYQDTNALQDGIFEMITDGKNLFMVGDMKQSIYRFRGSEPLVFRGKADTYKSRKNAKERKITLSKNFRSRKEVLNSVNELFESCMSRVVGEIEYDKSQKLNLGNDGYEKNSEDYTSEFVLIEQDKNGENAPSRAELEAEYIARRIVDMKKNRFLVRDKIEVQKDGVVQLVDSTRPIRNSDILILMSSHKTDGPIFRETLMKYGIDCYCDHEGFFIQPEIKLMMSLLRAIENPQLDIPLVAVMRSVIGGFTDDEIATIRAYESKKSFFDALCSVYEKYLLLKDKGNVGEGAELFGEKVASFVERMNIWRDESRYLSAERMINMLYEQTGIYSFFGATDSGQAVANLQLLFDRAKQYERAGYRGLSAFLKYMEKLEKTGDDLEGAGFSVGGDYVRIMTIHKSKGLEEPVVFLAGTGKRFNTKDASGRLVMHNRLGFSLDYMNYNENILIQSVVKGMFASAINEELLSEEMRKLYVALTRAKEKIIVTAHIEKNSKTEALMENWKEIGSINMASEAAYAKTFADWIGPVSMNSDFWNFVFVENLELQKKTTEEKKIDNIDLPDIKTALSILNYSYPYAAIGIKSKAAVSDFKGFHKSKLAEKPKFMAGKRMNGAEFGTAVHKIMETLPREKGNDEVFIKRHLELLTEAGFITEEIAKTVNAQKILRFYSSELGKRYIAADKVNLESEFEIGIDASKLTGDMSLEGEEVLLQGVIDCWFEEDDGIVLIDYKTDRVKEIDEIHQKYDIQLQLYAEALEKIAKKRVKEKFIYLFSMDCVVQC